MIARYNADGTRDTSFGTGGAVYIPNSVLFTTASVAVDGSGNILVGGTDTDSNGAIARFSASGALDGSFGSSGVSGDGVAGNISGIVTIGSSIYGMVANTGDFTAVKFDNSGTLIPASAAAASPLGTVAISIRHSPWSLITAESCSPAIQLGPLIQTQAATVQITLRLCSSIMEAISMPRSTVRA